MRRIVMMVACLAAATVCGSAASQLPPDAVMLDKVKIPEKVKSEEFDPVTKELADPDLPTWEHEGVQYGSSQPDSREKFMADPAKYIDEAEKARFEHNFIQAMSTIWCPVTDEISPGGGLIWNELGIKWESCCQFCNDTKTDEDFPRALKRLKTRAAKSYELMGGAKYTEGANSPVEGAIDLGGPVAAQEEPTASEMQVAAAPAWLPEVNGDPTWANPIGAIVENRCAECHRDGGVAPMKLLSVGQIRQWSKNLRTHIEQGTMPPWPADKSQEFANAKKLTPKEKELFLAWIDAGFPPGEEQYVIEETEWAIGEPDHVVTMEEYVTPDDVADHIKEFDVDTGLGEDKWVVAAEAKPYDTFIVLEINGGPLGEYNMGDFTTKLPEGHAFLLKAGEPAKVRIFYTTEIGWEDYDTETKFGLKFGNPAEIKHRVRIDRMANDEFTIPPGSDNTQVSSEFTFPEDGHIVSVNPVTRQRGKSVEVKAILPGGREQILLTIPHWDPMWQFRYVMPEPVDAPKGTKVQMTVTFDNSEMNAKNPDPTAEVHAGEGGELVEGWLHYTLTSDAQALASNPEDSAKEEIATD